MVVIGLQSVLFAVFTVVYSSAQGLRPEPSWLWRLRSVWTLERGLAIAGLLAAGGVAGVAAAVMGWHGAKFGRLPYEHALRVVLTSALALMMSCELALGTFFLGVLETRRPAPSPRLAREDVAVGLSAEAEKDLVAVNGQIGMSTPPQLPAGNLQAAE